MREPSRFRRLPANSSSRACRGGVTGWAGATLETGAQQNWRVHWLRRLLFGTADKAVTGATSMQPAGERTATGEAPVFEPIVSTPDYLSTEEGAALLSDPRFWMGFLNVAFMPQAKVLDSDLIAGVIGLEEAEVVTWWDELSGNDGAAFNETDGYIGRPRTLRVPFEAGRQLELQFHPGAVIYEMRGAAGNAESLAELSGNWVLPGMSWAEVELLANAATRRGNVPYAAAILLLLPLAYPYEGTAIEKVEYAVRGAIVDLGFVTEDGAGRLAAAWRQDAERLRIDPS